MLKIIMFKKVIAHELCRVLDMSNQEYYRDTNSYYNSKDRQFNKMLLETELDKVTVLREDGQLLDCINKDVITIGSFKINIISMSDNLDVIDVFAEYVDHSHSSKHERFSLRPDILTTIINHILKEKEGMDYNKYIDKLTKVIGDEAVANYHKVAMGKSVDNTRPISEFSIINDEVRLINGEEPSLVHEYLSQQSCVVRSVGSCIVNDYNVLVQINGKLYPVVDIVFHRPIKSIVFIYKEV